LKIGLYVLTGFSIIWGLAGMSGLDPGPVVALLLGALIVAIAVGVAVLSTRWATASGDVVRNPAGNAQAVFNLVNVGQVVLILIAVLGLVKAGSPGLIPSAVCLVVGLHFIPLARVFDVPTYYLLAAAMVAVAVAGAVIHWSGGADASVQAFVGFLAAVCLWTASLVSARRGR
jgi:hypothetical protein